MPSAGPSDVDKEIYVNNLTFSHNPLNASLEPSLIDINLLLPKGSRTILVGANGGALAFTFLEGKV